MSILGKNEDLPIDPGAAIVSLWSSSGYNDQGLFFTLFLGTFLVLAFSSLASFLLSTPILWIKRLYRPNHTIKPISISNLQQSRNSVFVSSPSNGIRRNFSTVSVDDLNTSSKVDASFSFLRVLSPTVRVDVTAHGPSPKQRETVTRCKRLGVSLPYRSAFFQLPTLEDWMNVEETSLPYLSQVARLNQCSNSGTDTHARTGAERSSSPMSSRSGTPAPNNAFSATIPTEVVSGEKKLPPSLCSETVCPLVTTTSSPVRYKVYGTLHDEKGGSSKNVDVVDNITGGRETNMEREGGGSLVSSPDTPPPKKTMRPPPLFDRETVLPRPISPPGAPQSPEQPVSPSPPTQLPKTPLDPQVSMYLFTLKYFVSVLFLGMIFTIWICPISASDSYMGKYIVWRDSHVCHRHNTSQSRCQSLSPYCVFEDGKCNPVAVRGVYQLNVQNISPQSSLWWGVSLLNVGFSLVFAVVTVYYVKRSSEFIRVVMKAQMQQALGYRVSCVRGLDSGFFSEESFRQRYLTEEAYFPPMNPSPPPPPTPTSSGRATRTESSSQNTNLPSEVIFSPRNAPNEEEYHNVECCGISCLYSIFRFERYKTRRTDAIFTEPGRVRHISLTRSSPPGMYSAIYKTERGLSALQEAVAHEKALKRQYRMLSVAQRESSQPVSIVEQQEPNPPPNSEEAVQVVVAEGQSTFDMMGNVDPPILMMRAPFPSCCQKIPAVPYREAKFRKYASALNRVIAKVPQQRTAGSVFVVFSDALSSFEFVNLFNYRNARSFHSTSAVIAGPASRVIPGNLPVGRFALYIRVFLLLVLFVVLVFFWSIPVGLLSSLDNIAALPGIGPPLYYAYVTYLPPSIQNIVTAYLPVVVLAIFNSVLPFIIRWMVEAMGVFNENERNGGQLYFQHLFMVLTAVIFQAALQGGFDQLSNMLTGMDEGALQNFFVSCVTPQGGYWYAKVIMAIALSAWMELLDPVAILKLFMARGTAHVQRRYDALFAPCNFDYAKIYSFDLMILSIGLLFHMTVPLLTFFAALFFVVRYYTMRQRLFERYRPRLKPLEDCTDFGVSAQVVRSVLALFTLSEFSGVWLMHLRRHTGGMVICALTCVISVALWIWVGNQTRYWVASLSTARTFFQNSNRVEISSSSQASNHASHQTDGMAAPLLHHMDPSRPGRVEAVNRPDDEVGGSGEERENMESPHEEAFTVMEDAQTNEGNPFSGHLLPRQKSQVSRYHPKHQRLATLDIDGEILRMKETEFVVERYWTQAISWFETDHVEEEVYSSSLFPAT